MQNLGPWYDRPRPVSDGSSSRARLTWASGIRDAALDPVHPLLGTLPILGTEVIHSLAGLEL